LKKLVRETTYICGHQSEPCGASDNLRALRGASDKAGPKNTETRETFDSCYDHGQESFMRRKAIEQAPRMTGKDHERNQVCTVYTFCASGLQSSPTTPPNVIDMLSSTSTSQWTMQPIHSEALVHDVFLYEHSCTPYHPRKQLLKPSRYGLTFRRLNESNTTPHNTGSWAVKVHRNPEMKSNLSQIHHSSGLTNSVRHLSTLSSKSCMRNTRTLLPIPLRQ